MARPSQGIDAALLRSGRALYPHAGCAGLAVRQVAGHAGVRPSLFHYHFGSKDAFLRQVLQQTYDAMYAGLLDQAAHEGPALRRLHDALVLLARFVRDHRGFVARVWGDAMGGEAVAREFIAANVPRHVGLLMQLATQAQSEGALREVPPLASLVFLMGAVVAPMMIATGLLEMGVAPAPLRAHADAQLLSDAAIGQRVAMALAGLAAQAPVAKAAGPAPARRPAARKERP
jgi:AcrR family transcriptional regulator